METGISKAKKRLHLALDIGAQMLASGAEIERVEDSLERICKAFGAHEVEAFAITYMIAVTVSSDHFDDITQIRRVKMNERNLSKLSELNALSRAICENHMTFEEAQNRFQEICHHKEHSLKVLMMIYALISASFAIFFGGSSRDMVVSGLIGALIAPIDYILMGISFNRFVRICVCSLCAGALSVFSIFLHAGNSADLISIGNIMIFIPGVIFTTGITEILSNNMLSGMTRVAEAMLLSVVIATGFVLANIIL